tara:strand:- start:324 stop:779 length:456 start_codon:yes stop_codon:yes gene_type:complete
MSGDLFPTDQPEPPPKRDQEADLVGYYRQLFPHLPQPRAVIGPGVREAAARALRVQPLVQWWGFFNEVVAEGEGGWLWEKGNLGMLLRKRTVEQWACGQYRSKRIKSSVPAHTVRTHEVAPARSESEKAEAAEALRKIRESGAPWSSGRKR